MKDQYRWAEYVAVAVDVLGQKCQFKRIQDFFIADVPNETLNDVAAKTVGVVESIRDMLNELFSSSATLVGTKMNVSKREKAEYDKARATSPISFRFFSDSILAYVPLRATGYQLNDWFAIHDIFISAGGTLLGTLVKEASFRAAIELGIGTELEDGDLYGPIRAEIHELEKSADYPRIVIGDRFYKHLKSFSEGYPRIPCKTKRESIGCKNTANLCRMMIAEDPNDKHLILDYLGSDFMIRNDPLGEFYNAAREYVEQVLQERSGFENDKVANKFRKLRNYFDSRPPRT